MDARNHGKPASLGGRLRECPPHRAAPVAPPLFRCVAHPNSLATGLISVQHANRVGKNTSAGRLVQRNKEGGRRPDDIRGTECHADRNTSVRRLVQRNKEGGRRPDDIRGTECHADRNTSVRRLVQRNKEGGRRPDDIRGTECHAGVFRVTVEFERAHNPTQTLAPC